MESGGPIVSVSLHDLDTTVVVALSVDAVVVFAAAVVTSELAVVGEPEPEPEAPPTGKLWASVMAYRKARTTVSTFHDADDDRSWMGPRGGATPAAAASDNDDDDANDVRLMVNVLTCS